jgi:hypothetical protein
MHRGAEHTKVQHTTRAEHTTQGMRAPTATHYQGRTRMNTCGECGHKFGEARQSGTRAETTGNKSVVTRTGGLRRGITARTRHAHATTSNNAPRDARNDNKRPPTQSHRPPIPRYQLQQKHALTGYRRVGQGKNTGGDRSHMVLGYVQLHSATYAQPIETTETSRGGGGRR